MVGVWEGLNLGSIPNFFLCFGMHPKIIDVYPKLIPKEGVVQFCPLIQEILVHLFKKYLSTCLLVDCPLEPIAQQHHPKQAPFQKRVFTLSMFSLLKIGYVVTAYLSFLQIFGVIKERGMSICQFVKTPRRPQKCQVFLLSHEAPRFNTNFKSGNQNN